MVNPGAFQGKRKEYLMSRKPDYEVAFEQGTLEDTLSNIIQTFFRMFPPDKPLEYEPTDDEIEEALDKEPTDVNVPNPATMDDEEYEEALKKWTERQHNIKTIKAKITRWMAYQYLKDHDLLKKGFKGPDNPYATLAFQLLGISLKKPRRVPAMTLWRRSCRVEIEIAAKARCKAEGKPLKTGLAPIREDIAKKRFKALSQTEKDVFSEQAQREHKAALAKWEEERKKPMPTDPVSRQQCISNLAAVLQPLLDLIAEATGWKITLIAGGPCPARGGRMNMISIHSGTTLGELPMTFARFESVRYQKYLVPMFTSFLRECYSVEECRDRALETEEDDSGQLDMDESDPNGPTLDLLPDREGSNAPPVSQMETPQPPPSPSDISPGSPILTRPPSPADTLPPLHPSTPYSPRSPQSPRSSPQSPRSLPQSPRPPPQSRSISPPAAEANATELSPPGTRPQAPEITPVVTPTSVTALPAGNITAMEGTSTKRAAAGGLEGEVSRRKARRVDTPAEDTVRPNANKSSGRRGRGRAGAEGAVAPVLMVTASSQPWFVDCMRIFTEGSSGLGPDKDQSLGDDWVALVQAWSKFQVQAGFSEDKKLPTKNRPFPIKEWIARARSTNYRPNITDLKDYETTFHSWWGSMQPAWRMADGKVDISRVDGDWSALRYPGVNGLVSVVAALFYWGIAARGNKARTASWSKAICDCTVAFSHLA